MLRGEFRWQPVTLPGAWHLVPGTWQGGGDTQGHWSDAATRSFARWWKHLRCHSTRPWAQLGKTEKLCQCHPDCYLLHRRLIVNLGNCKGGGCTNLNDLTVVGSCANTRIFKKELGAAKLSFATESIFASPTIPSCKRTQTVVCTFLEQLWTSIESWQWNLIWQQQKTVRSLFLVNCLTDLAGLHRLDASSFSSFRCWTVSSLLQ